MSSDWLSAAFGIIGVVAGAFVTGYFTNRMSRENRRADSQRQTLLDLQDQLVSYMDASNEMLWSMPSDYDPKSYMPPLPPLPYGPIESLESYTNRRFFAAKMRQIEGSNKLQRLGPRVRNAQIRTKLDELLELDWTEGARHDRYKADYQKYLLNKSLNDLIGKQLREM